MSQFFALPSDIDAARAIALLRGEEARHLGRVTRVKKGDEVRIFDGGGNRYLGIAADFSGDTLLLEKLSPLPSCEPKKELTVAQALIKGDRWEWFLEKAVELGALRIIPLITSRTVARPDREGSGKKVERWRKILLSAAKQCERGKIPEITAPLGLAEFLRVLGPAEKSEERFFCAERAGARFLSPGAEKNKSLVALGPEGGWSEEEAASLVKTGFSPVSLGERILRSETAAIAALSVFLAAEHVK
ncbi:16S rRNA (uracil(1498)-N(3))-methyltransferase [bacterium]|nr:MAG: 16S rRNA (uracil(1498)-N(3))-methyltransferase [bacterium]